MTSQNGYAPGSWPCWNPVSLVGTLGRPDYAGFVLLVSWFASIALCVWWGIATSSFTWNLWQFNLFGLPVEIMYFYLPWVICVPLVMWLGLEWAVIPAYLATLFNTLHTGVPVGAALVNALHFPLGLTAYFLVFSALSDGYVLRSRRSWLAFLIAALAAALVGSIGAFISGFAVATTGAQILDRWMNWSSSNFLQTLVIVTPIIYFISPPVERLKLRYLPRVGTEPIRYQRLLQFTGMFALTLVLLILMDNHWQAGRVAATLKMPMADALRAQMQTQLVVQQGIVWVLAALVITFSMAGVIVVHRQLRRLRQLADAETHTVREELHRSEAHFRQLFENNPTPMWVYDPENGRFLEVNLAAVRRYGYSRTEFLNMTIFDIRPAEEAERLRKQKSPARTEAFRHAGEWRHRCRDGSLVDVEMDINSMQMDGRNVHLALAHDLSVRRQAQAAMEQRARELRILASASLEIASAQTAAQILQIGVERARQLIGANLAVIHNRKQIGHEGIGWHVSLAPQYTGWPDFKAAPDSGRIHTLLSQVVQPLRLTREELRQHPQFGAWQETDLPLNGLLILPLLNEGSTAGALMVADKLAGEFDVQDEVLLTQLTQITCVGIENMRLNWVLHQHLHDLEQRIAERTADLNASNRELDAFAYSVAHDLRAPLRAMHGFADALQEDYGPRLDDAGRNYLLRIVKASQNMDTLIQDLLAYSRLGRKQMTMGAVLLDEVVKEVLTDLAAEIATRHANIRVRVPPLVVEAHHRTLRQVILNLVSNAIKFVAPGKIPEVLIQAQVDAGKVMLSVADNGIGIAPEYHQRIFNVFERLHGVETYPGTGIGLSIVKKGLMLMHGDIRVQSDDAGTLFQASLKEFKRE